MDNVWAKNGPRVLTDCLRKICDSKPSRINDWHCPPNSVEILNTEEHNWDKFDEIYKAEDTQSVMKKLEVISFNKALI